MIGERTVVRIFIISNPAIYRDALRLLLDGESDFRVVGAAANCEQALQAARMCRPDILVFDIATSLASDREPLAELARGCAPACILLLAPALDRAEFIEALRCGVRGVLTKGASSELLFRSIRAVAAGQYWIERAKLVELVQSLAATAPSGGTTVDGEKFRLTTRERDIVAALAAGCTNKEIARRFAIGETTVKFHLTKIFDKLGLSNRVDLARFAFHHGLIAPDAAVAHEAGARRPAAIRSPRSSHN
jgi:DNA-binding NarL/FixJ family response regulator